MRLPTPREIKHNFTSSSFVADARKTAANILERKDPRLVVIVGPCSIHDIDSALEYATRLKALTPEIEHAFFPIMRVFVEKPRTRLGWKGMLYDPLLDGSHDIELGLKKSRELMVKITAMGIPCATELLDPIAAPYFDDLLVWGLIGARTGASQPHRQMASGMPFPVGFKNDCEGRLDAAISGILAAKMAHSHLGVDEEGHITALTTVGNPLSHLVLRGSNHHPNYDDASIGLALAALKQARLEPRLLVDCSHGNSGKDFKRQSDVFESVVHNPAIAGLMLESHLFEGKQPLTEDPSHLSYGVSITDGCIGWEETERLLRSASMSFVQN